MSAVDEEKGDKVAVEEEISTTKVAVEEEISLTQYYTKEILLGITIGCAQIPESVAFAFLAHVKPHIALHSAWMVGGFCSLFGGRPAMVNGATGAFAAIIATMIPKPVEDGGNGEGIETLFPSVMLGGVLMLGAGGFKLNRFILLLPAPVMVGFCNGLAVVIGAAQLHPFKDSDTHEWKSGAELGWMLAITAASMLTMEFLPKIPLKVFKLIPSSLIAIFVACFMEFVIVRSAGSRTDTIGDVSKFTEDTRFPVPFFIARDVADYDLSKLFESVDSVMTIVINGFLLCMVGTIESLMTSEVVESFVKTPSNGQRTVGAMGVANIISGFFGGMGGNAMIGLSTINVLNGGRGRTAPCVVALVVMIAIVGAYPLLNFIPVAALAGIMLVVVLHTFKWHSLKLCLNLLPQRGRKALGHNAKIPRIEVVVIIMVTLMSILTNIAYAVVAGVAVCAVAFSWNAGQELEVHASEHEGKKIYRINGPIFFTSANRLRKILAPENDNTDKIEVWFGFASVMDYTAIATLHQIAIDYKAAGKNISFKSLNLSSQKIIEKATDLVQSIEYTPKEPMAIPEVPGIADGYAQHPAAAPMALQPPAEAATGASKQDQADQLQSEVTL